MGWDGVYHHPAPGHPDPAPGTSVHTGIVPSYPFGITGLLEHIRQPVRECSGTEKTKKTNKKISDRLNKSSSTRATARAIPSRAAHRARPPLPRASGRIFPSLHRRPGRNIAHIHRKEPPARYREMPETLLPGVSAWVRGGRGQERCRRPVFFPRETQWVLFCRESGGSSWKDIARAGAFLSPLPAHASPPGSSTVL